MAELARKAYPSRDIVIAGDNDTKTEGTPEDQAKAAAQAVGGKWVVPLFEDSPDLSDFNDLHQLNGLWMPYGERLAEAKPAKFPGVRVASCSKKTACMPWKKTKTAFHFPSRCVPPPRGGPDQGR